jgi:putative hemolysin
MVVNRTMMAVLLVSFCCVNIGCTNDPPPEPEAETPQVSLANPAAVKCVEDGFKVEPQLENGVPVGSWCVDPATNSRCEAWAWFRGECSL